MGAHVTGGRAKMAAAGANHSHRSRWTSFHFVRPRLASGIGRQLACVLAGVCVLTSRWAAADEADFVTEEFLKKEFSLAKPYRGECACRRPPGCPGAADGGLANRVQVNQDN